MIGQIWSRLLLLFSPTIGLRIGDAKVQVRALDGEPLSNIDRIEPYGFSYRPKAGCRPYVFFPNGDRTYGFALVVADKRYQMTLQEGEVALHDDEGNHVAILRGGIIKAKAATKVIADTPLFETTADALIGGNLVVKGATQSNEGYYGDEGGAARVRAGLHVENEFTVNGKDVSEHHRHNTPAGLSDEVI